MDIGIIVALVVAITLTLIAGVLAGLFGGMWWQARKTAEVWEKAYTHVRELVSVIRHDTYNTGRETPPPSRPRATGGPVEGNFNYGLVGEQPPEQGLAKERVVMQADVRPSTELKYTPPPVAPVEPSAAAQRFSTRTTGVGAYSTGIDLDDDPLGPQIRK